MKKKKLVIVVFGNKGVGKDTYANMLAQVIGDRALRLAFAGPIKAIGELALGIPRSTGTHNPAHKNTFKVYGRSAREWWQWLGTEFGRQINQNIWVDRLAQSIKHAFRHSVFIVSDGRFDNERTHLREVLGADYEVQNIRIHRNTSLPADSHQSESELNTLQDGGFEEVIFNDGPIGSLLDMARDHAKEIISGHSELRADAEEFVGETVRWSSSGTEKVGKVIAFIRSGERMSTKLPQGINIQHPRVEADKDTSHLPRLLIEVLRFGRKDLTPLASHFYGPTWKKGKFEILPPAPTVAPAPAEAATE